AVGYWRPTPPLFAPGAASQFATMTPWVLERPSQFRLPPPYSVNSPGFATDLNETKIMGALAGSPRTADQSELALFWQGNAPLFWNRTAVQFSVQHVLSSVQTAPLFALLTPSITDPATACWDSKSRSAFWPPTPAIREGLPPADANPAWEPWLDFFKA